MPTSSSHHHEKDRQTCCSFCMRRIFQFPIIDNPQTDNLLLPKRSCSSHHPPYTLPLPTFLSLPTTQHLLFCFPTSPPCLTRAFSCLPACFCFVYFLLFSTCSLRHVVPHMAFSTHAFKTPPSPACCLSQHFYMCILPCSCGMGTLLLSPPLPATNHPGRLLCLLLFLRVRAFGLSGIVSPWRALCHAPSPARAALRMRTRCTAHHRAARAYRLAPYAFCPTTRAVYFVHYTTYLLAPATLPRLHLPTVLPLTPATANTRRCYARCCALPPHTLCPIRALCRALYRPTHTCARTLPRIHFARTTHGAAFAPAAHAHTTARARYHLSCHFRAARRTHAHRALRGTPRTRGLAALAARTHRAHTHGTPCQPSLRLAWTGRLGSISFLIKRRDGFGWDGLGICI